MKYLAIIILSMISTIVCRWLAIKLQIVDAPTTSVKTHTKTTPYLGGIAILFSGLLGLLVFQEGDLQNKQILEIVALLVISILGLLDDKFGLSIGIRWVFQLFTVALLIGAGNILGLTDNYTVNVCFTCFGILFMINAMNILDIMDGLAGGLTTIMLIGFVLLNNELAINSYYSELSSIFIFALLGFLIFNFNPAKIFMGDCGSTTLGVLLSILFINTYNLSPTEGGKASAFILLTLPIFEVVFVSIIRIKKGLNPMHGSKDHFALRLRFMGYSIKQSVLIAYVLCAFCVLMAYFAISLSGTSLIQLLVVLIFFVISFGTKMATIHVQ